MSLVTSSEKLQTSDVWGGCDLHHVQTRNRQKHREGETQSCGCDLLLLELFTAHVSVCCRYTGAHLSRSCTCRRTRSSRSAPAGPWAAPAAEVAAAGRTGCWSGRGRTAWRSRRAASRRRTSACWQSAGRTDPWWRTRLWRTGSRLEQMKKRKKKIIRTDLRVSSLVSSSLCFERVF